MNTFKQLNKSFALFIAPILSVTGLSVTGLFATVLSTAAVADIQQGYIVTRVQYNGASWQMVEQPRVIPCHRKVQPQALSANHSIVEGYNALAGKVTEFRFPNPRMVMREEGTVLENNIVTDIIIPLDAGLTSLKFKENQQSADSSLTIDVSNVQAPAINCQPPQYPLKPLPVEVAPDEV